MKEKYKFLEHTADLKVQAFGKNIEEAFVNSSLAMKEAICGRIKIKEKIIKEIEIKGKNYESLLYNFLEEFLFFLDAEDFIIASVKDLELKEDLSGFLLSAKILGDKASRYKFSNDVKAITYNEMLVSEKKNKCVIQFVVDV